MRNRSIAVALTALAAASACSGGGQKVAVKPAAVTSPSPTPSPTASRAPVLPDMLTGGTPASGPVVAAKIDNAPLARPYQKGLDRAAVVYQELVEGGLTRFLAVFEVDRAGTADVGPVRSARESDVGVLRAYDAPPLGFSGANAGVLAIFRSAARAGYLKDGSYDDLTGAYRLGAHRKDARNFFVDLGKLSSLNAHNTVKDVGFTFSDVAPAGVAAPKATASFSPFTRVTVTYSAATKTWRVSQNGVPYAGVAPANVVVQRVAIRGSRFKDIHGQPTPYTVTTGTGAVTVLRDGRRIAGTWKRAGYGATRFYDATGKQIALRPGPTWVLLLPTTGSLAF